MRGVPSASRDDKAISKTSLNKEIASLPAVARNDEIKTANIILTGQKKYSEIPLYLKAADCLVITGTAKDERSFRFTSPLKLFEYMASARPIVASDTESIREVLEHKKNAWLVRPDDEKAMADGIMFILNTPDSADNFAKQARFDVENYTWGKRAEKIISAINS